MYKKILVAMDGSETAYLALDEAIKIAKELGAVIRVIGVVDELGLIPSTEFGAYGDLAESIRDSLRKDLDLASSRAIAAGVDVDTRLLRTDIDAARIPEAIENAAKEWPADIIVIGTHGRRGFNHLLLGSVAEALIRLSTKPVLLIRSAGKS